MSSLLPAPAEVPASEPDQPGWEFAPGTRIAEGLYAWELLGDGHRFETWLAWSTSHWCAVSVKLARPEYVASERAVASLRREAGYLRELHHPSFQRLLEERLDAEIPLLVCEYVEGPSLSTLIDDDPLSAIDAVLVGLQLSSALHYLHRNGLVHLDLKPGNALLREGRVVLIDLGLARPVGSPNPPGNARGTSDYMAPEQCRKMPADPAMDMFALGTVLYELVTGEQAFDGDSEHGDNHYQQLKTRPVPAERLVEDLPADVAAVLDRLLEPEPSDRISTAAEALRALGALIPEDDEGLWPEWATDLLPTQ